MLNMVHTTVARCARKPVSVEAVNNLFYGSFCPATVLEDESHASSSKTISFVYKSDSGIPDTIFDEF